MPGDLSPLSLCALDSVSAGGWVPFTFQLPPGTSSRVSWALVTAAPLLVRQTSRRSLLPAVAAV